MTNTRPNAVKKKNQLSGLTAEQQKSSDKNLGASQLHNKGLHLTDERQYIEAIRTFTQALNLSKNARIYAGRGTAYALLGQYENAICDYLDAIKLNPYEESFRSLPGRLYYCQGKNNEAIDEYTAAIKVWSGTAYMAITLT